MHTRIIIDYVFNRLRRFEIRRARSRRHSASAKLRRQYLMISRGIDSTSR